MEVKIENSWKELLQPEFEKKYFENLVLFLKQEKQNKKVIYPQGQHIFHAFEKTPFDQVKVVILGQDPYHGAGQAHGLCFSVPENITPPPSLKNIFKELYNDLKIPPPNHGNLEKWAEQGVLLLNATLTVEDGKAASHSNIGWQTFTDKVIEIINLQKEKIVFILWGNFAKQKMALIDTQKHYVLTAAHPSPLSAHSGFFGCKHFSQTNDYLVSINTTPIQWQL